MTSVHTDVASLRALLFCRRVSATDARATTLEAVHDERQAAAFPARFADLLLYVSFETLRRDAIDFEIALRSPMSRRPRVVHHGSAAEGRPRTLDTVIDLGGVDFEAAGRYAFALYVGGLLVGTAALTVSA